VCCRQEGPHDASRSSFIMNKLSRTDTIALLSDAAARRAVDSFRHECDNHDIRSYVTCCASLVIKSYTALILSSQSLTSSSAIAERPHYRVGQFWPKVEDDILQTVYRAIFNHCDVVGLYSYGIR